MEMKICHNCRMEHPVEYTCARVQQDTQRSPILLKHARSRYYQALGSKSDLDHVADSYHYAETRLKARQEQLKMMAERGLEPQPGMLADIKKLADEADKLYGGALQGGKSRVKAVLDELADIPFGHGLLDPRTGRISNAQRSYQEIPRKATIYPDPSARRDAEHKQAITQPVARFDPFAGYEVRYSETYREPYSNGLGVVTTSAYSLGKPPAAKPHPLQRVTEQPGWDGQSKWRPWK